MNSIYLVFFAFFCFFCGYKYYSKYISKHIFNLDNNNKTPSHTHRDDVDYIPTNKHILFGHHFTSIAGAAPIIGPCIAVFWGWLPALIWVVIGTVFMGAVHDFGALTVSLKEKGRSIADITSKVINKRTRIMFLCFVMCLTWLVLAVFAMAIAKLFTLYPSSVLPVNIEIIIALIIGYLIYKKKLNSFIPSVLALIILYVSIYLGTLYPISLDGISTFKWFNFEVWIELSQSEALSLWIILLFIYSSIASLLPVWLLLQPRDYINSHQLIVGLSLIYASILIFRPEITAPALNLSSGGPPIIPFLFVTIACGAISGFHGLVSSGTTSKQINKESDARLIGYGSMLGEGSLALATIIASVAGIALVTNCEVNGIFHEHLAWNNYYDTWEHAANNKFMAFVLGGGALLEKLGLSVEISRTLISVLIISFAATTLDTATRIQRMIIMELGAATNISPLKNKVFATILGVIPAYLLTLNGTGWQLWPVFGASNQMLAALTLMVLSIYFWKKGKNILPLLIPMIFIMIITIISLFIKTNEFFTTGNYLLLTINILLISLIIWMIIEGSLQVKNKVFK
ncbi:MAG: carbon starvation protein A [Candidatus Marinimicrobia bacterium]|nr:carbon starvation protein A [Candidatus Neomarinimicrobiota bacterium]